MFKKLFKSLSGETDTYTSNSAVEVIDSAHIQKDLKMSFDQLLSEFNLIGSKESEIEKLKSERLLFKTRNEELYAKIEKLKSFGFVNTPSVKVQLEKLKSQEEEIKVKISDIEAKIQFSQNLDRLTREYAIKYAGYKFIDRNTMVSVMKKYDLYMGETFMYAREIPERALGLIGNFKSVIDESKMVYDLVLRRYSISRFSGTYHIQPRDTTMSSEPKRDYYQKVIQSFELSCLQMVAPLSHFEFPTYKMTKYTGRSLYNNLGQEEIEVPLVEISKNDHMLRLSANETNRVERENREVLDPIACIKVEGGFVIIDTWDKEAEIPEIKNPVIN